jgi:hypothetical protein
MAPKSKRWNPVSGVPHDKVLLAGIPTPGYCEIVGASSPRNWEEQSPGGWSGGILLYKGIKLSHFSLRCDLYEDADWDDWYRLEPIVARSQGRRAIGCQHPFLAALGISALVIEDTYAPVQTDHGVWQIELTCIDWRALKATGTSNPEAADEAPLSPLQQAIKKQDEDNKRLDEEVKRAAAGGNLPSAASVLDALGLGGSGQ